MFCFNSVGLIICMMMWPFAVYFILYLCKCSDFACLCLCLWFRLFGLRSVVS